MKNLSFLLVTGSLVLVLVLVMLVSPKACGASSSITTSLGMSIAESNTELEFLMDSEFGRMLASSSGYAYDASKIRDNPTFGCGRAQRYCLPSENPSGGKRCDLYNRQCH